MNDTFNTAIAETKYTYRHETPIQEDFLATFRSFYVALCVTGCDDDFSMSEALNRAATIYADDIAA